MQLDTIFYVWEAVTTEGPDGALPKELRLIHVRPFTSILVASYTPGGAETYSTELLSTHRMHRIDLPQDETLRSAQQRVQLGKTTRVRYSSLPR